MKKSLLLLFLCVACSNSHKNDKSENGSLKNNSITKLNWLSGTWQNLSNHGNLFESWQIKNDSLMLGKSFFIKGKDTLFSESVELQQKDKDLFYTPIVKNQNDGKPVSFKLTSNTENEFIFENLQHDFPQKISYTRVNKDSLYAEVSGMVKGELKVEKFPMQRKK